MTMARTEFNKESEGPKYLLPGSLCVNSYSTSFVQIQIECFPDKNELRCSSVVMEVPCLWRVQWESVSLRRPHNASRVEQVATALSLK